MPRRTVALTKALPFLLLAGSGCHGGDCLDSGFSGVNVQIHITHDWPDGEYQLETTTSRWVRESGLSVWNGGRLSPGGDCWENEGVVHCRYEHANDFPDTVQLVIRSETDTIFDETIEPREEVVHDRQKHCGADGVYANVQANF
jgi:hypothetical protein